MTVKLTPSQKIKVLSAAQLYPIMQQTLLHENKIDRNKEHFWLVCLANNNRILMIELISLGSVNATIVEPMDVFSFPLQKSAVKKIIMVHNHPSGEMRPSLSDIDITERMYAIGQFINMPVLDHVIISEKEFYSFKDTGLMTKIQKEKRYDLTFKEMDKITAQLKKAEKDKDNALKQLKQKEKDKAIAIKDKGKEIAKNLLEQGIPVEAIVKATGLTKGEITKLTR